MANKQTIIGKTAPVPLGQQKAVNSLPVVFAEDQPALPVEEQNKIQSEVALSLLGIPRAEVALGIFADVNTYDVNPNEWSQFPIENDPVTGTGVNHLDKEAGAQLVASAGRTTILTSKRFFRYQPGRVSSSTMGVKMNRTQSTYAPIPNRNIMKGAPSIKKWGIFDKYDGYYFEIVNSGDENDFRCVRRTQALVPNEPAGIETTPARWTGITGGGDSSNILEGNWGKVGEDPVIYRNGLCYVAAAIYDPSLCYDPDDVEAVENGASLSDYTYDEGYAVRLAYRDASNNFVEHLNGRQFQFPFDQKEPGTFTNDDYQTWKQGNGIDLLRPVSEYIRLDAHCRWEGLVTNLSRGSGTGFDAEIGTVSDTVGSRIGATASDSRFGYDSAPSAANSGVKVWNLLVSVQGSTAVSAGQFTNVFGVSNHRTAAYNPASSTIGVKNLTLKEWFKICVPKQYRVVYEWRPVRAMFSNDRLDGITKDVRWSDVSTANVGAGEISVKRPGDKISVDGEPLTSTSKYEIDFTKVTMWKIDFSWYGAVGALFLCYVPVSNNEARWVRVHHMRASNQLEVASLGNATLPITYLTHCGISSGLPNNKSTLVKYGASYYIDGGDKGTVKLLSKSSDYAKNVAYGGIKTSCMDPASNYFSIATAGSVTQNEKDQLIGSYLKSDTTMSVIWTENEGSNIRLYFNKDTSAYTDEGDIELIVPRRQRAMIALRAKDEVTNTAGTPIRNRIQLYPIKYGIGVTQNNSDSNKNILTVNFIKNPLLITNNLDNDPSALSSTYGFNIYTNSGSPNNGFNLGSGTVPQIITDVTNTNTYGVLTGLLPVSGAYLHCYMRGISTSSVPISGFAASPSVNEFPALVRIFRKGNSIYIQNYASRSEPATVFGTLMPVFMYHFDVEGGISKFTGDFDHTQYEDQKKWNESFVGTFSSIAQLSGASVSQDFRLSPVAETGSTIFSLYCNPGGSQFDLTDYFAYNKEYISYPLTDEVDVLCAYGMWESSSSTSQPTTPLSIVNSLTWEEQ
jgi:hypothetical protein